MLRAKEVLASRKRLRVEERHRGSAAQEGWSETEDSEPALMPGTLEKGQRETWAGSVRPHVVPLDTKS